MEKCPVSVHHLVQKRLLNPIQKCQNYCLSLSFISEPFRTLISEAGHLAEFMQSQIVNGDEQNYLPKDKGE